MMRPEGEILYGIDGGYERIYDGVIIWVMADGRVVNRFAGEPGYERLEARIDEYMRELQVPND